MFNGVYDFDWTTSLKNAANVAEIIPTKEAGLGINFLQFSLGVAQCLHL